MASPRRSPAARAQGQSFAQELPGPFELADREVGVAEVVERHGLPAPVAELAEERERLVPAGEGVPPATRVAVEGGEVVQSLRLLSRLADLPPQGQGFAEEAAALRQARRGGRERRPGCSGVFLPGRAVRHLGEAAEGQLITSGRAVQLASDLRRQAEVVESHDLVPGLAELPEDGHGLGEEGTGGLRLAQLLAGQGGAVQAGGFGAAPAEPAPQIPGLLEAFEGGGQLAEPTVEVPQAEERPGFGGGILQLSPAGQGGFEGGEGGAVGRGLASREGDSSFCDGTLRGQAVFRDAGQRLEAQAVASRCGTEPPPDLDHERLGLGRIEVTSSVPLRPKGRSTVANASPARPTSTVTSVPSCSTVRRQSPGSSSRGW